MKIKYIGLLVIGLLLVILYFFIDPSTYFFPQCPLYTTTGIYCPGCGSQRAFHDLLHLDIQNALRYNSLFLLGLVVLLYHFTIKLYNKLCKKKVANYIYHKWTPRIIIAIIILFWIFRNIPYYPFTLLKLD